MSGSWAVFIIGMVNLALGWAAGIFWEKGNQSRRSADGGYTTVTDLDPNDGFWGIALDVSRAHQPEPGGCTCGFCCWSGEHVALMVAGAIEAVVTAGLAR